MNSSEVILNLWYTLDCKTNLIYSLSGRAYLFNGTDNQKNNILQSLAHTDYQLSKQFSVPKRFSIEYKSKEMIGVVPTSALKIEGIHLFEEVIQALEQDFPKRTLFYEDNPHISTIKIPENPLFLITGLMEDPSGILQPL